MNSVRMTLSRGGISYTQLSVFQDEVDYRFFLKKKSRFIPFF
jgi:hypothetical protein